MRKRQAPWNKYEAVILLQGVLDVQSGKLSRMDAIKEVSARLRKMALNSGIEIDDTYRNVNGISFQMCSMESAYYGRTIVKSATKLFRETVSMSKKDFSQTLLDAYSLIYGTGEHKETEAPTEMAQSANTLEKTGPQKDNALMGALQRIMKRVAGPKTRGVSTTYLAFALKCTEDEVLALLRQADWVEKCGDMYRCDASKIQPKMPSKSANTSVPGKKARGKNIPSTDRLRSIMALFAPENSSGVTKEYLSFALGCPTDQVLDFVSQFDWVEKIGDRFRLRGSQIAPQSITDVKPTQQKDTLENKVSAVSEATSVEQTFSDIQHQKINAAPVLKQVEGKKRNTTSLKLNDAKKESAGNYSPDYIRCPRDRELFEKYPVLFKRTFNALKNSTGPAALSQIFNATSRISRIGAVQVILDGASWSRQENTLYTFVAKNSDNRVNSNDVTNAQGISVLNAQNSTIDFNEIGDLSFTKPVSYQYFDIYRTSFDSWKELYADFLGCYYEDYPHLLYSGVTFSAKDSVRPDIVDCSQKDVLIAPREIPGSNLYVETNFNVSNIVRRIKRLLDIGNLDYENLTISYTRGATPLTALEKSEEVADTPTSTSTQEVNKFTDWLRDAGTVETNIKNFVTAINLSEKYARELKCTHTKFWGDDYTETKLAYNELLANNKFVLLNQRKSNIFSRALRKYMEFQRDRQQRQAPQQEKPVADMLPPKVKAAPEELVAKPIENIHALLLEEYPNGFRLNSSLEMKKFKKKYESKYGTALGMPDDQCEWSIRQCGIVHDNRLYCPEKMLSDDTKEKLEEYIKESFQKGKKCLFFEALFNVFSEKFLDQNIYNAGMLKAYLQSIYRGQYFFFSNYFSLDPNATSDPTEEIKNCMIECGKSVAYEELYRLLPHIPEDKIRLTLNTTKEFISNGRKQYFHIDTFQISDDELNDTADIIHSLIQQNKYISGNELIAAIRVKIPYVLESNSEISDIGVRNALALLLENKFSFKGNIISARNVEIEMKDVFSEFSQNTPNFTIDELSKLASDLNTAIYFDYVYKNAVRISLDNFVRKDQISFDVQKIDQILDSFCPGKYISIQDITNFVAFPDCGYPWNSFLLESFVTGHSKRYCLLHNTFGIKSVSGAIVKRSSGISALDMLVTLVLADSNCPLKKDQALEYLYDYGYLGQRRYSHIEQVLIDAQTIRNKRGM